MQSLSLSQLSLSEKWTITGQGFLCETCKTVQTAAMESHMRSTLRDVLGGTGFAPFSIKIQASLSQSIAALIHYTWLQESWCWANGMHALLHRLAYIHGKNKRLCYIIWNPFLKHKTDLAYRNRAQLSPSPLSENLSPVTLKMPPCHFFWWAAIVESPILQQSYSSDAFLICKSKDDNLSLYRHWKENTHIDKVCSWSHQGTKPCDSFALNRK